jgi:hypothetical protein
MNGSALRMLGSVSSEGIIILVILFIAFVAMIVWVMCLKKPYISTMDKLPLQNSSEPKSEHGEGDKPKEG